jgi:hypothetical protein
MRQFEIKQANRLLETMLARSEDAQVVAFMTQLASLAGISRVQAQVGLRTLTATGRVTIEARGARGTPGRFRILNAEPIRRSEADLVAEPAEAVAAQAPIAAMPAARLAATVVEDLRTRELAALHHENAALRERVAILEQRLALVDAQGDVGVSALGRRDSAARRSL